MRQKKLHQKCNITMFSTSTSGRTAFVGKQKVRVQKNSVHIEDTTKTER